MAVRRWLGDTLMNAGLVSRQQLDEALAVQNTTGQKLGQTLVSLGYLTDAALLQTLCADAGIPFLSDAEIQPEPAAVALIPVELARSHAVMPNAATTARGPPGGDKAAGMRLTPNRSGLTLGCRLL